MSVEDWVKQLTEDVVGGSHVAVGFYYHHPEDGPIKIISGQYWGDHGLSNHWTWRVLATGHTHHGYAGDWPRIDEPNA